MGIAAQGQNLESSFMFFLFVLFLVQIVSLLEVGLLVVHCIMRLLGHLAFPSVPVGAIASGHQSIPWSCPLLQGIFANHLSKALVDHRALACVFISAPFGGSKPRYPGDHLEKNEKRVVTNPKKVPVWFWPTANWRLCKLSGPVVVKHLRHLEFHHCAFCDGFGHDLDTA